MQVYCQVEARRSGPDWPIHCPHSSSLIYSLSDFCTVFNTAFAGSGAGQILVREWGDEAARKLAVALYRWERLIADLSETEEAEIDDFYLRRLRPQERAAVLRRLAA